MTYSKKQFRHAVRLLAQEEEISYAQARHRLERKGSEPLQVVYDELNDWERVKFVKPLALQPLPAPPAEQAFLPGKPCPGCGSIKTIMESDGHVQWNRCMSCEWGDR